ncbi:hypothetical protein L7F22_008838 [Adiantum nelumboides]|nr:hypothetical protein [Adiantum nelumboides]
MAAGEGQSNPSTSGDAGGDHNADFGNEYGPPLPTQEGLRKMEHRRLVGEATNLMLNFAKDPKLAKYMTETAFQDVHAQWKATTISPLKPDSKKQYSEKELEEEIDARLARILGAQKQGKKHDKKRKKSTDFPGYLSSQSTFDKAKKHKKRATVPSSSSSSESSSESSEEERSGKKRSKKHRHGKCHKWSYILFRAKLRKPNFSPGVESLECALFNIDEIPFDQIAFSSISVALRLYVEDYKQGNLKVHHGVIEKRTGASPSDPAGYAVRDHICI